MAIDIHEIEKYDFPPSYYGDGDFFYGDGLGNSLQRGVWDFVSNIDKETGNGVGMGRQTDNPNREG